MPTPMTRLAMEMMFSEKSAYFMKMKAMSTDTGMELAVINEALRSPKNKSRMTMEMMMAMISVERTESSELLMDS